MNRLVPALVALALASAAHAGDQSDKFYRQTTYMLAPPTAQMEVCAETQGVPASLFGNQVDSIETTSPDGKTLTLSAKYPDGSTTTFQFFLDRRDCARAAMSTTKDAHAAEQAPSEPWFLVAAQYNQCVLLSAVMPGVNTPEDLERVEISAHKSGRLMHNGPDIALLIDRTGQESTLAMVRGQDKCIIAMKLTQPKQ